MSLAIARVEGRAACIVAATPLAAWPPVTGDGDIKCSVTCATSRVSLRPS